MLVDANTTDATSKLSKFDRQLAATNDAARKGIEARLGARYDPVAFKEYQAALDKASLRSKDRAAFKAELGANFNPTAFREYQTAIARANAESETATKLTTEQSAQLQSIRTRSKQVAQGVLGIAAASVYAAVKFQSATTTLQTQAGASTKQVEKLREGMLKMAGDVGQTPDALAKGMYHVVSSMNALLPPAKRVAGELHIQKIAAEGAAVGHTDLEETTYALASAMNALHAPTTAAHKIMGQMNAIVGAGDMTMTDLLDVMKTGLVPTAKTFGISFRSVGAALAVMGDMGIRGAEAGTKLRMSIALMGAPSKAAAKILEALGLSTTDATARASKMSMTLVQAGISTTQLANDLRKPNGISVALSDLKKHLEDGGLSAEAAAAAISRAFGGGRSGAAIQLLTQNTDRLNLKFGQIGKTAGDFGAAFAKTQKTAQFQLHALEGTTIALGIQLGNMLLPTVIKIADALRVFVTQIQNGKGAGGEFASVVVSAFKTVKDVVTSVVGAVGGFGNAVKIMIGAFVASKIYDVVKAFQALRVAMATTPIGLFLSVVGGLATAFGLLSSSQSRAATTAQDVADAWNNARQAANALRDSNLAVTQAKLDEISASRAEAAAAREVQKLQADGKVGTQQYKDAVLALENAQVQHTRTQNALKDATDQAKTSQKQATQATQDAIQKDKARVATLQDQKNQMSDSQQETDAYRQKTEQLNKAVEKLNADQSLLNGALKAMPTAVNSTVKVAVDFLSNVPGAIAAMGAGAAKGIAQQVGHNATGGVVNKPGYFAGEEAPRHPEVILATNPAYRSRNVDLWQQAGGMLGIPGFATGGFPYAAAGPEVRQIDPWTARRASAWIKPIAQAWGTQHSIAGRMIGAANSITGLPYTWGGGHGGFFGAPGFDCSGAVSYVLHAGNLLASPVTTDGLKVWGDPGPGKQITVGVRGTTGPNAHTMMELFGKFFESGGAGGGPHWDAGWDGTFPILRHPPGFAQGGVFGKGDFGDVPPRMLLAMNPSLAKNPKFWEYVKHAPRFARGGVFGANLTAKGAPLDSLQRSYASRIVAIGKSLGASPTAIAAVIAEAIAESDLGRVMGWDVSNPTYGGLLAGSRANFGSLGSARSSAVTTAEITAALRGGRGYASGGAMRLAQSSHKLLQIAMANSGSGTQFLGQPGHRAYGREAWGLFNALIRTAGGSSGSGGGRSGSGGGTTPNPPRTPRTTKPVNIPAAHALAGVLGGVQRRFDALANIPSQSVAGQLQMAGLSNKLTRQQNAGIPLATQLTAAEALYAAATTPAEQATALAAITAAQGAITANRGAQATTERGQLAIQQTWLRVDKAKLKKINQALKKKNLTPKGRAQLLRDKLALVQEIGTVEGSIGSLTQSIADLTATPPEDQAIIDAMNAQTDAIKAQTAAAASLQAAFDANTHYMQSIGAVETQQAIKALSDVISGQIGGRYYSRATGSAGDGTVARYGSVARA